MPRIIEVLSLKESVFKEKTKKVYYKNHHRYYEIRNFVLLLKALNLCKSVLNSILMRKMWI